jgi:hypothetical protein
VGQALVAGSSIPRFLLLSVSQYSLSDLSLTQDVPSSGTFNLDLESLASLNDTDFSWLHIQHAKLGLYVERALLRYDQEISIRVDNSLAVHARVGKKRVDRKTLAESRISGACNALETRDKVDLAI